MPSPARVHHATGPPPPEWEAYVFAGAEGRGVASNIFLDGNTFEDSHTVDREPSSTT